MNRRDAWFEAIRIVERSLDAEYGKPRPYVPRGPGLWARFLRRLKSFGKGK